MHNQAKHCAELIRNAKTITVLTGAGISTSAGIPDFRGPNGLYITKRYDSEKIFDIHCFTRDPKPFFEFARDFIKLEEEIQPTKAHFFLSELQKTQKLKGIITQNIDSLHQRAGSESVLEVHGSFWTSYCRDCGQKFNLEEMKGKIYHEEIPRCVCGGVIKPDIVFFGENVKDLEKAFGWAAAADLFFVIGTSCVVYPAAMVPTMTQGNIVVINMTKVDLHLPNVVLKVQEDIDGFFEKVGDGRKPFLTK